VVNQKTKVQELVLFQISGLMMLQLQKELSTISHIDILSTILMVQLQVWDQTLGPHSIICTMNGMDVNTMQNCMMVMSVTTEVKLENSAGVG